MMMLLPRYVPSVTGQIEVVNQFFFIIFLLETLSPLSLFVGAAKDTKELNEDALCTTKLHKSPINLFFPTNSTEA